MLFTSPVFLFIFLPVTLALYFGIPRSCQNGLLCLLSLVFYFLGSGGVATAILLLSIAVNYFGVKLFASLRPRTQVLYLVCLLTINVVPLVMFKYLSFLGDIIRESAGVFGVSLSTRPIKLELPVGISFFTFQALSYVADIYMRRITPARRLVDFGMYHACFPQLIAGPIVRYANVANEIEGRNVSLADFCNGLTQFCIGLAKKAVLADPLGRLADQAFSASHSGLTIVGSWLGLVAYTLQIYLDFSGYSDMAIGLGRMFGFHFPENFNQPYRSASVTEFWRRWHMTLSGWFRDYVYVPLGGNRHGTGRTLLNLLLVFFLCGLWHGAGYTFIVWGLYHGALLVTERLMCTWCHIRVPRPLGWLWTMLSIMLGWVAFRAADLPAAGAYLQSMFMGGKNIVGSPNLEVTPDMAAVLAIGTAVALVPFQRFVVFSGGRYDFSPAWSIFALGAAIIAIVTASVNGFTPFIYFRF